MPNDRPLILGFDTSAAHCAAALLSGDRIIAERSENMTKGQAERLVGLLEETLADAGVSWSDLAAIGVGVGPGNFTGIRISVSAARGLALGLGISAVGVSTFQALTHRAVLPVSALVSAPKDQVFRQDFTREGTGDPFIQLRQAALDEVGQAGYSLASGLSAAKLAQNIALIAAQNWKTGPQPPAPLYVRAADANPARDAPPALLDG